jgi:adenylylsulfate kinase
MGERRGLRGSRSGEQASGRARSLKKRVIGAVLFDLDGTLYQSPEYTRAFRREVVAFAAKRLRKSKAGIHRLLETAERAGKSLTQTLSDAGLPKEEWHRAMSKKTALYALIPREAAPRAVFRALRARGFRVGIVTNAARAVANELLRRIGIPPADSSILVTGSDAAPKPSPEPFRRAADALRIPLNEVAYVGDRVAQEVLPAMRLGMVGILLDRGDGPKPRGADYRVSSLVEIPPLIETIAVPPPQPVVWISGRPAAGKSTVSRLLQEALQGRGTPAVVLDSDALRNAVFPEPAYSENEKTLIYRVLFASAKTISHAGAVVIISATGFKRELRAEARALFPRYLEAYLDCPVETAIQRDPKSLYAKALSGDISTLPGISLPYEEPNQADITIDSAKSTAPRTARTILRALLKL